MLNDFCPYRLAATVLVPTLVLLLGVGGVTLMQLCVLGSLTATTQAASEMPEMPPCHGGMPDSGEESGHEAPVTPGGSTTCCFAVVAVSVGHATAIAPAQSFAPVLALLSPFVASAVAPTTTPAPRDTGPPLLPVRSHLAFSVLLI